jgi:hypothetical protein
VRSEDVEAVRAAYFWLASLWDTFRDFSDDPDAFGEFGGPRCEGSCRFIASMPSTSAGRRAATPSGLLPLPLSCHPRRERLPVPIGRVTARRTVRRSSSWEALYEPPGTHIVRADFSDLGRQKFWRRLVETGSSHDDVACLLERPRTLAFAVRERHDVADALVHGRNSSPVPLVPEGGGHAPSDRARRESEEDDNNRGAAEGYELPLLELGDVNHFPAGHLLGRTIERNSGRLSSGAVRIRVVDHCDRRVVANSPSEQRHREGELPSALDIASRRRKPGDSKQRHENREHSEGNAEWTSHSSTPYG